MRHARPIRCALAVPTLALALVVDVGAQCPNSSGNAGPASFLGSTPGKGSIGASGSRSGASTSNSSSARQGLFGAAASTGCRSAVRGVSGRLSARGGAVTGSNSGQLEPLRPEWEAWWQDNRNAFLWDDRPASLNGTPKTAAQSLLTSRGSTDRGASGQPDRAPQRSQVYTEIVPLLLELASSQDDPLVLREVALALGRTAAPPLDAPVGEVLIDLLGHDDLGVQACAAMGLGLLGGDGGYGPLIEVATCSEAGHTLVGRSEVPDNLRATAAVALGLLDHESAVLPLVDMADRLPAGDDLIRSSAVLGLGLMQSDHAVEASPWLTDAASDRAMPLGLQVSVPTTLGRLRISGSRDTLLALLSDRDSDGPARQAAVVALGRIAALTDVDVRTELIERAAEDRDAGTRRLALLALARLPEGLGNDATALSDGKAAVGRLLERSVARPERDADRPWAALAAGIWVRRYTPERSRLGAALLDAYEDEGDPSMRGAYAIGLALAGVVTSIDQLQSDFAETHDQNLSGHLAVSLGLLGARNLGPTLRDAALQPGTSATLRADLAEALRLLDDDEAAAVFTAAFSDAGNSDARRGLASALGTLRHSQAIPALAAAASDEDLDPTSRARACAALGRLGEKTARPWHAKLTENGNPLYPHAIVTALAGDA